MRHKKKRSNLWNGLQPSLCRYALRQVSVSLFLPIFFFHSLLSFSLSHTPNYFDICFQKALPVASRHAGITSSCTWRPPAPVCPVAVCAVYDWLLLDNWLLAALVRYTGCYSLCFNTDFFSVVPRIHSDGGLGRQRARF